MDKQILIALTCFMSLFIIGLSPVLALQSDVFQSLYFSFDELNGNQVLDHSQHGNHGTLVGAPRLVLGKFGNALEFNGRSDGVEVPDAPSLDIRDEITLMAWVYPTRFTSEWLRIIVKTWAGDTAPWMVYGLYQRGGSNGKVGFIVSVDGGREVRCGNGPSPQLPLNRWTHLAATYDGSQMKLYYNGEVKVNVPATGQIDTNNVPLSIGRNSEGNREHYTGRIDEVRIWNRALSEAEILEQMNIGSDEGITPNPEVELPVQPVQQVGRPVVQLIYIRPSDGVPEPGIDAKIIRVVKGAQQFFANEMERHGFGRKTFLIETDATGKPVVHYVDNSGQIHQVNRQINQNIYSLIVDDQQQGCGSGGARSPKGGYAQIYYADGTCLTWNVVAHELGHAFGLQHDFRKDTYLMSYGAGKGELSKCAAEWLDVHPVFNTSGVSFNDNTNAKMLPPTLAFLPNAIRLRFEITDPDGIHQVQLHHTDRPGGNNYVLHSCKELNGNTRSTVDFITTELSPNTAIGLKIIDILGNFSVAGENYIGVSHPFSIDITPLLPPPEVVSIPDVDLDWVIRNSWQLDRQYRIQRRASPDAVPLTTHAILDLKRLNAPNRRITDLTGLEHAINLTVLDLGGELVNGNNVNSNAITNFSPLSRLTHLERLYLDGMFISDVAPLVSALSELKNLRNLNLSSTSISNVSPLAELTQLTTLILWYNSISDVSPLAGLTNLRELYIGDNSISDISSLAGLTNLRELTLSYNSISDISSLAGLTNLRELILWYNSISDISPLAGLTNLRGLALDGNTISDISPLASLTHLTFLHLSNTSISDVSVLADLTQLNRLYLSSNRLSDVSSLAGLTQLTTLDLSYNDISDVSPLVTLNLKGTSLDSAGLYLNGNPLSYASINTHIPTLQSRGVTVGFDNRTPATLLNISGVITAKNNVLTVEVRDSNGRAFEGVPVTFTVTSGSGTLSVTNTTTDPNGRAQSKLTLGKESNRVRVSAADTEQTVTFSDVAEAGVHIPDPNLRAAIEDALGVKSGSPISLEKMSTLTHLTAREAAIGVLIGLEFATNLTELRLGNNNIRDISPLSDLTNLRTLELFNNGIKDVSALVTVLSDLTNLTNLYLSYNRITDIAPLSGLTHLTELHLSGNNITDISPLSRLTNLRTLDLPHGIKNVPALVRVLSRLPHLKSLNLSYSKIKDVSVLIPVLSGLTDLIDLNLSGNGITDLSPLAVLMNLTSLHLWNNNISDISMVAELTNLTYLSLGNNNISDISAVAVLTNLSSIDLWNNNISDISPLVENTGLGAQGWGWVNVQKNPLSYQSIHKHIPALQSRGVTVDFDDQAHPVLLKILGDNQRRLPGETLTNPFVVEAQDENGSPLAGISVTFTVTEGGGTLSVKSTTTDAYGRAESTLTLGPNFGSNTVEVSAAGVEVLATFHAVAAIPEYLLSIPSGISLIHVPLRVTAVDGVPRTITSISDLYTALGGAGIVNFLITYDSHTQEWRSYFVPSDRGTSADVPLTDDTGIIAGLRAPVSIRLSGDPLGANGRGTITLNQGLNLVGLPLRDPRISRVSDLLTLTGIGGNVPVVILTDGGEFKLVGQPNDPGDIPIVGGQSFIMTAQRAATVSISGDGWYNVSGAMAAPLITLTGIQVTDTTPVLGLKGSIVSPIDGWGKMPHLRSGSSFRVIAKNLSTGRAVAGVTKDVNRSRTEKRESVGGDYQVTIVDVEAGRAAKIGDTLEISVRSPDPLIGVQPLRYTVTAEDVKQGLIQLGELFAYEIPTETKLLANYPNPFNPETWIPYRLAEDAFVTLTIYDLGGQVVRKLEVGHRIAAVYENRSKAAYWDGRNGLGEQVASGIYFYTLTAGDYSATRKMLILK